MEFSTVINKIFELAVIVESKKYYEMGSAEWIIALMNPELS